MYHKINKLNKTIDKLVEIITKLPKKLAMSINQCEYFLYLYTYV